MDILFIDIETGGLDPKKHDILSIGMVQWRGGAIVNRYEILVHGNPRRVTDGALAVSGIDLAEHNKVAMTRRKAAELFMSRVLDWFALRLSPATMVVLGGHNVAFDISFLRPFVDKYFEANTWSVYFSHRTVDTQSILAFHNIKTTGVVGYVGLQGGIDTFGLPVDDTKRHTALADAEASALLFQKLLEA